MFVAFFFIPHTLNSASDPPASFFLILFVLFTIGLGMHKGNADLIDLASVWNEQIGQDLHFSKQGASYL